MGKYGESIGEPKSEPGIFKKPPTAKKPVSSGQENRDQLINRKVAQVRSMLSAINAEGVAREGDSYIGPIVVKNRRGEVVNTHVPEAGEGDVQAGEPTDTPQ